MFPIAVTTVDFLPADFHAKRRSRRVRRGRWVIAGAFLLLMMLGFVGNQFQNALLRAEADRLKPQAAGVGDLRESLEQLTHQIQELDLQADLRSRLRLRPASTRLLAGVTAAMPEGLTLQELEIREERAIVTQTSSTRKAEANQPPKPPEQLDLDRLLANQSRHVMTVRGFAPSDATVSEYLARLRQAGIFDDVTMLFTDRYDRDGVEFRTFSVRLRVRSPLSRARTAATLGGGVS